MGTLRLLLVLIVVIYHARRLVPLPIIPFVPIPDGHEALWMFFTMSGFYMAVILNEKYTAGHNALFYANRWLRIWPMYVTALLFTGLFVIKTGVVCAMACADVPYLMALLQLIPTEWLLAIIVANVFMIGLDAQWAISFSQNGASFTPYPAMNGPLFTVVNPAWSLSVELVFYALAPFLVRSLPVVVAVLLASLGIHLYYGPSNHYFIFFFAPAVYLFFMAGALIWHLTKFAPSWFMQRKWQYAAFAFCFVLWQISNLIPQVDKLHPIGLHSYLKVIGFLPVIPVLFYLTARSKFDRFCADVSYPIFILHGPIFIYSLQYPLVAEGLPLTLFIIGTSLFAGFAGYWLVERPVGKWRERWTASKLQLAQKTQ